MAIATDCAPPPLSAATAYGPPGTARTAGPPSVLTDTDSGAAAKLTVAGPPPVVTVAVVEVTSWASRVPPPVSVSTDGGPALLAVPGGPYAVAADSGGGAQSVAFAPDPDARAALTVTTGGGPLRIEPDPGTPARG